ncbi:PLP-dependent transferase [Gonapodya prolifera JEL478]|uniref:PLP-dependent transferase n=1 Tax=Gonapodya prolifera (strain JEL478) TaxID=1344416 RepID=A0A139AT92_GONPJ|nr:PLP-dependent transferase [Gonapodya prolifera JEL478]|eukprot:KXS19942.1 PLP-dependent transferase [Gonapodya prolifera JEL478]
MSSPSFLSTRARALTAGSSAGSALSSGRTRAQANEYNKQSNPDGIINLGVAENRLMWPDVVQKVPVCRFASAIARFLLEWSGLPSLQLNDGFQYRSDHLQYPPYHGTDALRSAIASVLTSFLFPLPTAQITPNQLQITNGCCSAISVVASVLADVGEAVLVPAPYYGGFYSDIEYEAQVKCIGVDFEPPFFRVQVEGLDRAYTQAATQGVTVRALLICSPNNPFGNCYSRDELIDIMRWCAKRHVALVSDEIYAGSVWGSADDDPHDRLYPFVSVLAIDSELEAGLSRDMVHVLWGLSKDFMVNGLRVGVIQSRNKEVVAACRQLAKFHAIPHPLDSLLASILSDHAYVSRHVALNKERLSDMYAHLTCWLRKKNISWIRANAGFFVWLDLRAFVQGMGGRVASLEGGEREAGDSTPVDRSAERLLAERFLEAGVYIALGEAFFCRDLGTYIRAFFVCTVQMKRGVISGSRLVPSRVRDRELGDVGKRPGADVERS